MSVQARVLELFLELQQRLQFACLFITHDLAVVRSIADRVAVMYLGRLVEQQRTEDLFTHPEHPYTQALLSAALVADPRVQRTRRRTRLEGELPDPSNPPAGCVFSTRCPSAVDVCHAEMPELLPMADGGRVACHLVDTVPAQPVLPVH